MGFHVSLGECSKGFSTAKFTLVGAVAPLEKFPKFGTFLGIPRIRIMAFWSLCWAPLFWDIPGVLM